MGALPSFLAGLANATRVRGPYRISEKAQELHRRLTVIDLHADPLMWSRDLLKRNDHGHVDVPRLIEGGTALQVFSMVTHALLGINIRRNRTDAPDMFTALTIACGWPRKTWSSKLERALHQARALEAAAKCSSGRFGQVRTAEDLTELVVNRRHGTTAGLLSIEGAQAFEGREENVDVLFDAGVRMVGLTHFVDNEVGGSASGEEKGGLTDFGRRVLKRMEDKGIVIDLAHASPRLLDEAVEALRTPPRRLAHGRVRRVPQRAQPDRRSAQEDRREGRRDRRGVLEDRDGRHRRGRSRALPGRGDRRGGPPPCRARLGLRWRGPRAVRRDGSPAHHAGLARGGRVRRGHRPDYGRQRPAAPRRKPPLAIAADAQVHIIDSFSVEEARPDGMKAGWWFVTNGEPLAENKLPAVGCTALLRIPAGSTLEAKISAFDLRHAKKGVFGFQLVALTGADVPRLSECALPAA